MVQMLKQVEGTLVKRISSVETSLDRFNDIQEQLDELKTEMKGKGAAKDPNEPTLTSEDVAKWNGFEALIVQQGDSLKQL